VDRVREKVAHRMEKDLCILRSLGWVDQQGETIPSIVTRDTASLPAMVSDQLTEDSIASCARENVGITQLIHGERRCETQYTEEESSQLYQMKLKVAKYRCFQDRFHRGCKEYVRDQIYQYFQALAATITTAAVADTTTAAVTTNTPAVTTTNAAVTTNTPAVTPTNAAVTTKTPAITTNTAAVTTTNAATTEASATTTAATG